MAMWRVHRFKLEMSAVADHKSSDHASKPLPFLGSWGLPILILVAVNFLEDVIPFAAIVLIISGALLWMGFACVMNARRCHRRHCYYSGPIFIIGSVVVLLIGFEVISLGSDGITIAVGTTLSLALLTYLTEPVLGKYIE